MALKKGEARVGMFVYHRLSGNKRYKILGVNDRGSYDSLMVAGVTNSGKVMKKKTTGSMDDFFI